MVRRTVSDLHRESSELRLNVADLIHNRFDRWVLVQQNLRNEGFIRQSLVAKVQVRKMAGLFEGTRHLLKVRQKAGQNFVSRKVLVAQLKKELLWLAIIFLVEFLHFLG